MTNSDPSSPGRRDALRALAAAALGAPAMGQAQSGEHRVKELRYPFEVAETGFDPAQIIDLYSRIVAAHLFDALYGYDHLARPFKIRPNTAAAMPEISDNFRTYVIRLQPGIFFQDDARSKAGRANSSPRTTSTRSSASSTRAGNRPPTRRSPTSASSAWPRCANAH